MSMPRVLICALLTLVPWASHADSWVQPEVRSYASDATGYTFTVEPLLLSIQQLSLLQQATGDAGGAANAEYPKGRLVSPSGDLLWESRLVNRIAPVSALVSVSGQFVVTFDNWGAIGEGPDVVVIYGRAGQVIRALSLTDIVGPQRASTLRRSISSRWWSGEHQFESEDFLVLTVLAEGSDFFSADPQYDTIRVRLADGEVVGG